MGCASEGTRGKFLILGLCLFGVLSPALGAKDQPCAAKEEDAGYVCVCNSTYCDTVNRPATLKSGKYWHYSTSSSSPGFTSEKGSFSTKGTTSSYQFVVDSSVKYQTFTGIGAGFSDSAAIDFYKLPAKAQALLIETYFGETGIEYVFGRVPIGATDFSTRWYSYDETPGDTALKNFALADEDLSYKIPMIKLAKAASKRGLKTIATPWTAPKWMKLNNSSDIGYLSQKYEKTWANYLLKTLEAYKTNGADFWGLSLGNEPIMGLQAGFHMPNMVVLPPQLKTWTRDVFGPMIKKSDFKDVVIIALDDERDYVGWYARALLDDSQVAKYIDGFATHWYGDQAGNVGVLDNFYTKYPGKFLLFTESSLGGGGHVSANGITLGSWSQAERYITDIFQNLNNYVTGYIDWNICLNTDGGPYLQMALESSIIINTSTGEFYKNPFFYVLGHFSKFITPGAQRIQVTMTNSSSYDILDEFVLDSVDSEVGNPTPPGPPPTGGGGPTGGPGPGPQPTGGPGPGPQPTTTPSTDLVSIAALNPDGSHSFIVYNPQSVSVDITVKDSVQGKSFKKTIGAQSLNTFIYW